MSPMNEILFLSITVLFILGFTWHDRKARER